MKKGKRLNYDNGRASEYTFRHCLGWPWTTDIKQNLQDGDYNSCGILSGTFMYTTTPTHPIAAQSPFMQIQICPYFLAWALPTSNKWTVVLTADYWKSITVSLVEVLSRFKFAPVDAFSLFDKVMLHEVCLKDRHQKFLRKQFHWPRMCSWHMRFANHSQQ